MEVEHFSKVSADWLSVIGDSMLADYPATPRKNLSVDAARIIIDSLATLTCFNCD